MDTKKTGLFLKQLRKEHNMTQEQLGERIAVTNKTVSRWETGAYLPSVECLEQLSGIYQVSINEILAGKRVSGENFAELAEENLTAALNEMQSEKQKLERKMIGVMAVTTILAIAIILLLPMKTVKDFIILLLVVALAFIANTMNVAALVVAVAAWDGQAGNGRFGK